MRYLLTNKNYVCLLFASGFIISEFYFVVFVEESMTVNYSQYSNKIALSFLGYYIAALLGGLITTRVLYNKQGPHKSCQLFIGMGCILS